MAEHDHDDDPEPPDDSAYLSRRVLARGFRIVDTDGKPCRVEGGVAHVDRTWCVCGKWPERCPVEQRLGVRDPAPVAPLRTR